MFKVALEDQTSDRLNSIREALDAAGCAAHGRWDDFRAPCPLELDERRRLLHVWLSDDDRIAVHCFHGCTETGGRHDARPVMDALGLPMSLLFP